MSERSVEADLAVLELSPGATLAQVKNAYLRLRKLYAADSPLLSPISHEFPEEKRLGILLEVEEAYRNLLGHFRAETSEEPDAGKDGPLPQSSGRLRPGSGGRPEAREDVTFSGPVMKRIREDMGIPLETIFHSTKIRVEQLEAIEAERFEKLPDEAYLRVHLKEYAGLLLLNPKKVIADYLKRYADWRKAHPPPGR